MLALLAAACASTSAPLTPDAYHLEVTDNPAKQRFEVVLQSHHDRALCVEMYDWPTPEGALFVESSVVSLSTADGLLAVNSTMRSAYCPGGCGETRIEPGAALTGHFAYAAFGDAERIAADPSRRLQYTITPQVCRRRR
jgi:hypothetical protein